MTTTPDFWRGPFLDNTAPGDQRDGVIAATAGTLLALRERELSPSASAPTTRFSA